MYTAAAIEKLMDTFNMRISLSSNHLNYIPTLSVSVSYFDLDILREPQDNQIILNKMIREATIFIEGHRFTLEVYQKLGAYGKTCFGTPADEENRIKIEQKMNQIINEPELRDKLEYVKIDTINYLFGK